MSGVKNMYILCAILPSCSSWLWMHCQKQSSTNSCAWKKSWYSDCRCVGLQKLLLGSLIILQGGIRNYSYSTSCCWTGHPRTHEGQSSVGILCGSLQKIRVLACRLKWSCLLSITALLSLEVSFYLAHLSPVPELQGTVGAFKW